MSDEQTFRNYLLATNELLLEFAREAKQKADTTRGPAQNQFDAGYLNGFYRVVTLMQQQAAAFGLDLIDVGLEGIDAERDLI